MEYRTKDFYISACIIASGHSLVKIEKTNNKFSIFVLRVNPESAEKIIQKHWNYSLKLPTRNLIEAINELKTRLYGD